MNPIQIQSANPSAILPIIDGLSDTYKIVATGTKQPARARLNGVCLSG